MQPVALQIVAVAALQRVGEIRLLGDPDMIGRHLPHGLGRGRHAEVGQVVAVVIARGFAEDAVEGVDGQLDGAVADGVQSQLPAQPVTLAHFLVEFLRSHRELAAIVPLALVGFDGVSGWTGETAIDKNFDGAEPQALVSIAGLVCKCLQPLGARIPDLDGGAWQRLTLCAIDGLPLVPLLDAHAGKDETGDPER